MKRGPKPAYIATTETLVLRSTTDDDENRYIQIDDEGDFWISSDHPGNAEASQMLLRKAQVGPFIKLLRMAQNA